MPSTYTSKGYELQATGEHTDTWGTVANSNFSLIDSNLAGYLSVATTGGTTTLTSGQYANFGFSITGVLTSNATIVFPDTSGFYIVSNLTTGSYTVTVKTSTGTGIAIPQSGRALIFSDGTNMNLGFDNIVGNTTGDLKHRFGTGALTGWVLCNSTTIGSAASSATQRANADCQALYYLLWDAGFVPTGGRGASAAADWSANKPIPTPDMRGISLAGLDGMGTTAAGRLTSTTITGGADTLGNSGGAETIALTSSQNGAHSHSATADVAGAHSHTVPLAEIYFTGTSSGTGKAIRTDTTTPTSTNGDHTHTINVASSGSGSPHNNVQPTTVVSIYIKL